MAQLAIDFVADTYQIGANSYASLALALASGNLTFTRATTGTYRDSAGVVSSFASGALRRGNQGALIEPARGNVCFSSQDLANANWSKARLGATADTATAPDGTLTADSISDQTLTNAHLAQDQNNTYNYLGAGQPWCFSQFGAVGSGGTYLVISAPAGRFTANCWACIDLSSGAIVAGSDVLTAGVEVYANGFYRGWLTCNLVSTGGGASMQLCTSLVANPAAQFPSYLGANRTWFVWGAQVENGAYPSSYIPTTTAGVTRNADLLQIVLPAGTFTLKFTFDDNSTQTIAGIAGGTTYSVPTTLTRRYIKRIDDVTVAGGTMANHLAIAQTATAKSLGKSVAVQQLGLAQTAVGTASAGAVVTGDKLAVDFVADTYSIAGSVFTLAADAIAAGKMVFSRASGGSYKNAAGVLSYFTGNQLRRGDRGAVIEASRSNLVWNSEDLTSAQWSPARLSVVADSATGPDGLSNADTLNDGVAAQGHIVANRNANLQAYVAGSTYTMSCFFKIASPGNNFVQLAFANSAFGANCFVTLDMSAGTVVTSGSTAIVAASVSAYTDGWLRLILTATATTSANGPGLQIGLSNVAIPAAFIPAYAGANRTYYATDAQLELGVDASTYIQVPGNGPVVRNADLLQFAIPSGTYSLRYIFSDGSTQTVAAVSVANLYTVPTTLQMRVIRSISDISSLQVQTLGISQHVTGGIPNRGGGPQSLGIRQVATGLASLFPFPVGRDVALVASMSALARPKNAVVPERHQDISIPAGDSVKLVVTVDNDTSTSLLFAGAQYALARHYGGARRISKSEINGVVIQPPSPPDADGDSTTTVIIGIRPVDTSDLRPGTYIHELQLHARDGTITTVMRGQVTIAPTIAAVSPLGAEPAPRAVFGDASQHLGLSQTTSGGLVIPLPDTSASVWIANLGSDPGAPAKLIYDQGVKYLKGIGSPSGLNVWNKIAFGHLWAAHTADAACVNFKDPTGLKAIPVGGPAFNVRRGVVGDGVGAKINLNFNPLTRGDPNFVSANGGLTARNDATPIGSAPLIAQVGTTGVLSTLVPGGAGTAVARINATANISAVVTAPYDVVWSVDRESSTSTTFYKAGVAIGTGTSAAGVIQTGDFYLFGTTSYLNGECPWEVGHAGLSIDELAALTFALNYMADAMRAL